MCAVKSSHAGRGSSRRPPIDIDEQIVTERRPEERQPLLFSPALSAVIAMPASDFA
jgi:hypothetical protein